MIDNSYSTPLCQQPLSLGIDMSVHSATKYIGGHSDTMGGVVCGSRELIRRVFERGYMMLGGVAAPLNAWLLLRGLRRSEEHTSELQSLMRISYAVFCLNKHKQPNDLHYY